MASGTGEVQFSGLEVTPSERNTAHPEHFKAPNYPIATSTDVDDKECAPTISPRPTSTGSNRRKWLIIGVLITVVIVAVVLGATLGTLLGRHSKVHKSKSNSGATKPTSSATLHMSGTATSLTIYSYPTAVVPYPGHIEVFALDGSGNVYWKSKNTPNSAWMPQNNHFLYIEGVAAPFEQGIAAACRGASVIGIFVINLSNGLSHRSERPLPNSFASTWNATTWQDLGGLLGTGPTAVSWSDERMDVFVLGESPHYHLLRITYHSSTDAWTDWIDIGGSWQATTPTAVSWEPGRIDVFVINANSKTLNHAAGSSGDDWPFVDLGGYLTSRPIAVSRGAGSIDVFARGGDASLWHLSYVSGWGNKEWKPVDSNTPIQAEPEAVSCSIDSIELFAWREDNALVHLTLDMTAAGAAKASSGGFTVVGQGLSGPPKAVCDGANTVHVFAFLQNGEVGHRALNLKQNTWSPSSGFESLGKV